MFRIRLIVFAVFILVIGGLVILLLRGVDLSGGPEAMLTELGDELSNTRLSSIHHVAKRDGVREWSLDAASARYQKARNRTLLKGVSVRFFGQDGETVHVTGDSGVLYTDSMNIEVSGNVVVAAGSRTLKTKTLHYDHENRCVFTDTPVTIKDEGLTLAGNSMRFSLSRKEGSLWGDVRAVFNRPEMVFVGS